MQRKHIPVRFAAVLLLVLGGCGEDAPTPPPTVAIDATHVDPARCIECHEAEHEAWRGSHHDLAMQEATPETVLGDFDDATFERYGVTTRFYREDGKYRVCTQGPDGEPADFDVAYVFGVEPLQQYLIPFPGGRLQALSIAWDTRRDQWFHLYSDQEIAPVADMFLAGADLQVAALAFHGFDAVDGHIENRLHEMRFRSTDRRQRFLQIGDDFDAGIPVGEFVDGGTVEAFGDQGIQPHGPAVAFFAPGQ